ncbi:hypothetical protein SDC9_95281 [bioreactor metagenome]|uniref:Uncharacterized protein n=1 Tax=bioreactor metagenome TaxID=1076179 RepID=A0A645A6I4_9ZZZZ
MEYSHQKREKKSKENGELQKLSLMKTKLEEMKLAHVEVEKNIKSAAVNSVAM